MTVKQETDTPEGAAAVIYLRVSSKEQAEKGGEAEGDNEQRPREPERVLVGAGATGPSWGHGFSQNNLVRMRGLEPPRARAHRLLKPTRLPIPPHPRGFLRLTQWYLFCGYNSSARV